LPELRALVKLSNRGVNWRAAKGAFHLPRQTVVRAAGRLLNLLGVRAHGWQVSITACGSRWNLDDVERVGYN